MIRWEHENRGCDIVMGAEKTMKTLQDCDLLPREIFEYLEPGTGDPPHVLDWTVVITKNRIQGFMLEYARKAQSRLKSIDVLERAIEQHRAWMQQDFERHEDLMRLMDWLEEQE